MIQFRTAHQQPVRYCLGHHQRTATSRHQDRLGRLCCSLVPYNIWVWGGVHRSGEGGGQRDHMYSLHMHMCPPVIIIIIIKGHSIRRACLQPATNTQNSTPRPPTTNARSRGKLENKTKHCSKLSTGFIVSSITTC